MMFCSDCGKEIPEGTSKCPNCGKDNATNFTGQPINDFSSGVQASVDAFKKSQEDMKVNSLSEIIIDSQEQQIAVIGGSYLQNMLHGGGLKKGFGILTDKRFYFRGRCYTKVAGQHKLVDEEYVVDLEDITATGFVFSRRFLFLILAILTITTVFGAILFLLIYYLTKRAMYEVHFEGGVICVDVSKYGGINEVKAFNRALRKAKDSRKK